MLPIMLQTDLNAYKKHLRSCRSAPRRHSNATAFATVSRAPIMDPADTAYSPCCTVLATPLPWVLSLSALCLLKADTWALPDHANAGCMQLQCASTDCGTEQCDWHMQSAHRGGTGQHACYHTMRFGSTAKVLLKCKLKYYRISECTSHLVWPGI